MYKELEIEIEIEIVLPNLPFSELCSQSNTNSESSKSTIFRIGTNQTHPKKHRSLSSK